MKRLRVNLPGREYDIVIGAGLLRRSGDLIREVYQGDTLFIVTDSNVGPLYADALTGFETTVVTVPAGEGSKSQEQLAEVYNRLLGAGLTRGHLIIALGGGVVGDLAGYAAATLLRGVPFVQIPTTLLAMADSSVGGKVAVNHPRGKNLIGAFHQPKLVIADPLALDTLPPRVLSDGMGEVIKHGAIADAELFALLETGQAGGISARLREEIIYRNCDIKRRIVEADEFDTGGRMILNFGHTFGHAIEAAGGFSRYTHGEAVAMGMVMAAGLGERLGVTAPGTAERLKRAMIRYDLPAGPETGVDFRLMLTDKKRDGDILRLILLKEIGQAVIYPIDIAELGKLL